MADRSAREFAEQVVALRPPDEVTFEVALAVYGIEGLRILTEVADAAAQERADGG